MQKTALLIDGAGPFSDNFFLFFNSNVKKKLDFFSTLLPLYRGL